MAIESYETQLERVQAAIAAIESGGQDVRYGYKQVTYADLETLYEREKSLLALLRRESGGGVGYIAPRDA